MARFLLKRIGLALITLFLLSVIVFCLAQLLPGDIGRARLGGFASQEAGDQLNHELGVDRPILTQYWDWVSSFVRGDMGTSLQYDSPASTLLGEALVRSLKLAAEAFVIVVPLSILGGVWAALRYGRPTDRIVTTVGLSFAVVPEFVTGSILLLVFGIWLGWLPITAEYPPGSGPLTQIK